MASAAASIAIGGSQEALPPGRIFFASLATMLEHSRVGFGQAPQQASVTRR